MVSLAFQTKRGKSTASILDTHGQRLMAKEEKTWACMVEAEAALGLRVCLGLQRVCTGDCESVSSSVLHLSGGMFSQQRDILACAYQQGWGNPLRFLEG